MVFPIVGGTQSTGYDIDNSLRFNDDDSANLSRSISSSGSNTNASISFWLKRGTAFGSQQILFTNVKTDYYFRVNLNSSSRLEIIDVTNGSVSGKRVTNRLFRDPSAWYHIFIGIDGGQGTEENRVKLYINGVAETSWNSQTAWQSTFQMNADDLTHYVGQRGDSAQYFDGYMSEFNYVDGTTKAHTDFGEFNDNGVWIPKAYSGSYGTNGFFLEFQQTGTSADASGMGADTSGNDNHYAVTNLTATDVTVDTPTNNFATILSNYASSETNPPSSDFSEGNTKFIASTSAHSYGRCSIGVSSGKWYVETKITEGGAGQGSGLMSVPSESTNIYGDTQGAGFQVQLSSSNTQLRKKDKGVETTIFTDFASGNIAQMALDLDNGKMWLGNNGTWYNNNNASTTLDSNNPDITGLTSEMRLFAINSYKSGSDVNTYEINFGNAPFSISSGNSDANGYGNFEYAVPSGYYSLCTKNLAEFG